MGDQNRASPVGDDLERTQEEPGRGASLDQPGSLIALRCPPPVIEENKFLFSFSCSSATFYRGQNPPEEEA